MVQQKPYANKGGLGVLPQENFEIYDDLKVFLVASETTYASI